MNEDLQARFVYVPSDDEITEMFFARNEGAIVQTENKYARLFFSIAIGILDDPEDALECVNDTYFRMWNSIPPERPKNLRAYGAKIVKNLSINRAEYNSAACRGGDKIFEELDDSVPDTAQSMYSADEEISFAIDSFLRSIDQESRVIFVLRYWYCVPLEDIAKRMYCSVSKIKSRLFRTRKKLKSYLEKEGISL